MDPQPPLTVSAQCEKYHEEFLNFCSDSLMKSRNPHSWIPDGFFLVYLRAEQDFFSPNTIYQAEPELLTSDSFKGLLQTRAETPL